MTSERIQDQSQKSQSTSNESNKKDINFTPNQLRILEGVGRDKKSQKNPNNKSDNSSNNLNENKHEDNSATHIKASQRTSSATDMKASQEISSATDTEAFRSISSTTDEKADPGKTGKVEEGAYHGTREKWITDNKNEEEEAVDFETEYCTRHKSQKKQGASTRIMKVIQLEDEPLLPTLAE